MNTEQLRTALENAGLAQYQADAYIATVELGSAPAVEIADACDVPQARIYDVLRDLESQGYIETYDQGTLHAVANEPTSVLDDLHEYAESIVDAAAEIERRWEEPTIENHRVNIVKRFETVLDRAREIVGDADNEIMLAATPADYEALRPALEAAMERGVVVKLALHDDPGSGEPSVADRAPDFEGAATEVRYRGLPTPFLALVDRVNVCFAPETALHPANEYGVVVRDYSLARVFDWFFQTALWESWDAIYDGRPENPPITYTNLRTCIRDVKPLFDDGSEVVVTVRGRERASGGHREITGRIADIVFTDDWSPDAEEPQLRPYVEEATLVVETPEETQTVGGWGAMFEDIETERVTVETVS